MNNKPDSPPESKQHNSAENRHNRKHRGMGCLITFVILLAGGVIAAIVWGPGVFNRVLSQTDAPLIIIDDRTSPERWDAKRAQELAHLNEYGWVDQEANIARIPIVRAIELIAERGLPVDNVSTNMETAMSVSPATAPADLTNVTYIEHVLPIFEQHCAECHGAEDPEEGLELTRYRTALLGSMHGAVIEPGDPDNSYLIELIVSGEMPKRSDPLSSAEIEIITAWIEAGAPEN